MKLLLILALGWLPAFASTDVHLINETNKNVEFKATCFERYETRPLGTFMVSSSAELVINTSYCYKVLISYLQPYQSKSLLLSYEVLPGQYRPWIFTVDRSTSGTPIITMGRHWGPPPVLIQDLILR